MLWKLNSGLNNEKRHFISKEKLLTQNINEVFDAMFKLEQKYLLL